MSTRELPRRIERRVESVANPKGLDVKTVEQRSQSPDGEIYDVVLQGDDIPDEQNTLRVPKSSTEDMSVFGERLGRAMDRFRSDVLGQEVEIDRELQETEEQLEESDDDVEYGPGPVPDTSTLEDQGYQDEYVQVQSTSEIDMPETDDTEESSDPRADGSDETDSHQTKSHRMMDGGSSQSDTSGPKIDTDDLWGRIADTALEARRLEGKGHDVAAEALLTEIEAEIETYRGDDDD